MAVETVVLLTALLVGLSRGTRDCSATDMVGLSRGTRDCSATDMRTR